MPSKREYDLLMTSLNRPVEAGLAFFVRAALPAVALLCLAASAQTVHGTSPSVTSPGFGGTGSQPHGTPPSVTSLGFGHIPGSGRGTGNGHYGGSAYNYHRRGNGYGGGAVYYFPYAYPYVEDGPPEDAPDDSYYGGPTIFDRRGPGGPPPPPDNYYGDSGGAPQAEARNETPSFQPQTVLVFKDGHQAEVSNYAIVGDTLYDLSEGRHSKISISQLDIDATMKLNDDRGIEFQVPGTPAGAQAN